MDPVTPQSELSSQPQFQIQTSTSHPSLWEVIILLVIVLLLVAAGVYGGAAWQKGQEKGIVRDEIVTWQTYSNEEYGFELKYPREMNLTPNQGNNISLETAACDDITSTADGWPKDCVVYSLLIQSNSITIDGKGHVRTMVSVAGFPAERYEIEDGMWEGINGATIQFARGNVWYINGFSYHSENKNQAEALLGQILSTFIFTDSEATANWQTYRNEEYGFEVKYPNQLTLTENFVKNYDPEPENPDNKIFNYLNLTLAASDRQQFTFNLYVNHPGIGLEGTRVVSRSMVDIGSVTAEKEVNEVIEGHEEGYKLTVYSFKRGTDGYMVVTPFNELSDQIMTSWRFTK